MGGESRERVSWSRRIGRIFRDKWRVGGLACGVVFFSTLWSTETSVVALNYAAQLVFFAIVGLFLRRRFPPWKVAMTWATGVAAAAALLLHAGTDHYELHKENEKGFHVWQTFHRFSGRPYRARSLSPEGFEMWGGVAESGNPHGPWQGYNRADGRRAHYWCWYGEVVSEGEWHLRNRREAGGH